MRRYRCCIPSSRYRSGNGVGFRTFLMQTNGVRTSVQLRQQFVRNCGAWSRNLRVDRANRHILFQRAKVAPIRKAKVERERLPRDQRFTTTSTTMTTSGHFGNLGTFVCAANKRCRSFCCTVDKKKVICFCSIKYLRRTFEPHRSSAHLIERSIFLRTSFR